MNPSLKNLFRIGIGLFLLAATVLVNSYSGNLMSSLTVTKFKSAVNSMEDLAQHRNLTLTLSANSVFAQDILVTVLFSFNLKMNVLQFQMWAKFILSLQNKRTEHQSHTRQSEMRSVVIQTAFT